MMLDMIEAYRAAARRQGVVSTVRYPSLQVITVRSDDTVDFIERIWLLERSMFFVSRSSSASRRGSVGAAGRDASV